MREASLSCRECGCLLPLKDTYECPSCGGSLEVLYDIRPGREDRLEGFPPQGNGALWRFLDLLPIVDPGAIVSLGEGNTPMVKSHRAAATLGLDLDLAFKMETVSPSASFKDRPVSVAVSKARDLGLNTIVVASTGNTAASAAMYSARAGMKCVVCVPESTEDEKTAQALAHGAFVSRVRGNYSDAYRVARQAAALYHWCNISTTFTNPYTVEGDKTVAFELWLQMGKRVPDWVVVPIGAGPLLVGILKGFRELTQLGLARSLPRLVGVQAQVCAPIVEAFEQNLRHVKSWTRGTETAAHAIADPLTGYERDGDVTLRAIIASKGVAVAVPEADIEPSRKLLAALEGISVEPASATVLAALRQLFSTKKVVPGESVVCVMTGHGLKHPSKEAHAPPLVSRAEELHELVSRVTS
jgi:threonine synthase